MVRAGSAVEWRWRALERSWSLLCHAFLLALRDAEQRETGDPVFMRLSLPGAPEIVSGRAVLIQKGSLHHRQSAGP